MAFNAGPDYHSEQGVFDFNFNEIFSSGFLQEPTQITPSALQMSDSSIVEPGHQYHHRHAFPPLEPDQPSLSTNCPVQGGQISTESSKKRKRSKNSYTNCQRLKSYCSRENPCRRCSGPRPICVDPHKTGRISREPGTKTTRLRDACANCRKNKLRCSAGRPCDRCIRLERVCDLEPTSLSSNYHQEVLWENSTTAQYTSLTSGNFFGFYQNPCMPQDTPWAL
jgi:hypothetical protein